MTMKRDLPRGYEGIYPELIGYRREGKEYRAPTFPEACPICGAAFAAREGLPGFDRVEYDCGGIYEPKPQIQNHTYYWRGRCPKT